MRKPDHRKKDRIIAAAAELFATRPYHEVRLEDVAAEARVGKGTLYLHFESKDDLYLSLLYQGFSQLVDQLRSRPVYPDDSAVDRLSVMVRELVAFSFAHPHFYELTRRVGVPAGEARWDPPRRELFELLESEIRRGIARGELRDSHPEFTARYIPSLIRAALLYPPGRLTQRMLTRHILDLLTGGLAVEVNEPASSTRIG